MSVSFIYRDNNFEWVTAQVFVNPLLHNFFCNFNQNLASFKKDAMCSSISLFNDESAPSGHLSSSTWQEDTVPPRFKRADAIGCSR